MSDILDTRFDGKEAELPENFVKRGDDINITIKDPAMRKVHIGMGWDMNAFDVETPDIDVTLFLLDKNGMTRTNEDFIFYNNRETFGGGITHNFDSRTGAGDGDDESISINLEAIPFDIVHLEFVFSIYKGEEKLQNLSMVRNVFIRLANADTGFEILRYMMDTDLEDKQETTVIAATLEREGPKWHFRPKGEMVEGGLRVLAEKYGMVVAEQ
ncbi:MAG: TerD family protein [Alphaproteobacteria bacterium]